jgi:hypothetical protein
VYYGIWLFQALRFTLIYSLICDTCGGLRHRMVLNMVKMPKLRIVLMYDA